jgi:hypothetical protein
VWLLVWISRSRTGPADRPSFFQQFQQVSAYFQQLLKMNRCCSALLSSIRRLRNFSHIYFQQMLNNVREREPAF